MRGQITKEIIGFILRNHAGYDWSIQGLGMLRVYINAEYRLHIWHSSARVHNASVLHTHPWDFCSNVIAGCVVDFCFREMKSKIGKPYMKQVLHCGPEGGLVGEPEPVRIKQHKIKYYTAGAKYYHLPEDIHSSEFDDGTVTLVKRTFGEDSEHAAVYWKETEAWGDAKPRPATPEEVKLICDCAIERYW